MSAQEGLARTIEPDADLIEVARYRVSGSGPKGAAFTAVEQTTTPIEIDGLVAGDWSITVDGLNADGTIIATKTLSVTIFAGQQTNATFYLQWVAGTGNFDFTVTWPEYITTFATIEVVLSQDGMEEEVKFTLPASDATITDGMKTIKLDDITLSSGSYALELTFYDANNRVVGIKHLDQVNIHAGMTSMGSYEVPENMLPIEKPVINPSGGSLAVQQEITISSASQGVTIYYTTDGTDPSAGSTEYIGPFMLHRSATVKAIALSDTRIQSEITSAVFTVPAAAAPQFSVEAGSYSSAQELTISTTTEGATIIYTTDKSDPSTSETAITQSSSFTISITETTTIKAYSVHEWMDDSPVITKEYVITGISGLDIVNPPHLGVSLQLPVDWEGTIPGDAQGVVTAVVTPTPNGDEVTYAWYLDGTAALNNAGEPASTSNTLRFGAAEDEVTLGAGPHVLLVKATKGSMTYTDQKMLIADSRLIKISTPQELRSFAHRVTSGESFVGKTVKLVADIDLQDEPWVPIGSSAHPFNGTFDGNGKTIRNMTIRPTSSDNVAYPYRAFFSVLGNATVKNLVFESVDIPAGGTGMAAVVCGLIKGNAMIDNVVILSGRIVNPGRNTGGIAAYSNNYRWSITNCVNYASIEGAVVGGMIGIAKSDNETSYGNFENCSIVFNCVNYGDLIVGGSGFGNGGIVGEAIVRVRILNCTNHGDISTSGDGVNIGGIVGKTYNTTEVANCVNMGDILATGTKTASYRTVVGGIIGLNSSFANLIVTNCLNTGNVTHTGAEGYAAGIICDTAGSATDVFFACINTGNITASGADGRAAGIAATLDSTITGKYSYCYNSGTVSGSSAQGLVGGKNGEIKNSLNAGIVEGSFTAIISTKTSMANCYYYDGTTLKDHTGSEVSDISGTVDALNADLTSPFWADENGMIKPLGLSVFQ